MGKILFETMEKKDDDYLTSKGIKYLIGMDQKTNMIVHKCRKQYGLIFVATYLIMEHNYQNYDQITVLEEGSLWAKNNKPLRKEAREQENHTPRVTAIKLLHSGYDSSRTLEYFFSIQQYVRSFIFISIFKYFVLQLMSHNFMDREKREDLNSKASKLKEIDELYNTQIKQIYQESKELTKQKQRLLYEKKDRHQSPQVSSIVRNSDTLKRVRSNDNILKSDIMGDEEKSNKVMTPNSPKGDQKFAKSNFLNFNEYKAEEQKIRASTYLQGESTRTIEILRKQIENKELKIRELANKCENLTDKLKKFLPPHQLEIEMENIKQYSDRTMERLENLMKIKNEEIFFKIKLQIIGLLQQFQIPRSEIDGIKQVSNQTALFSWMVRKLKIKIKDMRSKENESSEQIQQDKIVNQHFQQRINFLSETNELLRLSESKLKNKIEDLKTQFNQYIQKIKEKQIEVEDRENQIFRLKKQNEEILVLNQKLNQDQRSSKSVQSNEKKIFEVKEKEMTSLLNSYYLERKKLESLLQEKQGEISEILIREKFLQTQNEKLNREYVRWKERYEWLQKQKENRATEYEEQRTQLLDEFEEYKQHHNQSIYMEYKVQLDEAMRKIEAYQTELQTIMTKLEEERHSNLIREEADQQRFQKAERQWLQKLKYVEESKQNQMFDLINDHELRVKEKNEQFEKRQQLLESEMMAKLRAKLAENDKNATQKLIALQKENDDLKRQIEIIRQNLSAKQAYMNGLKNSNSYYSNTGHSL